MLCVLSVKKHINLNVNEYQPSAYIFWNPGKLNCPQKIEDLFEETFNSQES